MYFELVTVVIDAAPDIVTGVRDTFDAAAEVLVATDYADACPIETVALEVASSNETLRIATAAVFESWTDGAAERFVAAGIAREHARELALFVIAALVGAFAVPRDEEHRSDACRGRGRGRRRAARARVARHRAGPSRRPHGHGWTGFSHDSSAKRAKSESALTISSPCSMQSAASAASLTRSGRRSRSRIRHRRR
jgi:hypothetical protein